MSLRTHWNRFKADRFSPQRRLTYVAIYLLLSGVTIYAIDERVLLYFLIAYIGAILTYRL